MTTATAVATAAPAETMAPEETTVPAETAAPAETTGWTRTAAPAETTAPVTSGLALEVADVTGQKRVQFNHVPPDSTVKELIEDSVPRMNLPEKSAKGRPFVYHMRLEREGRHLHSSERLADAVQTGDRLVLQPNIEAGGF